MARASIIDFQGTKGGLSLKSAVKAAERDTNRWPHLDGDGVYLQDEEFTIGQTRVIQHGLGRMPRGWQVDSIQATAAVASPIREVRADRSDKSLKLVNNSVALTCNIWIF